MSQLDPKRNEALFWSVFRNAYLKSEIYIHFHLFEKNKVKEFETLKELKEYIQHRYIETLIYYGYDKLNKGDIKNIDGTLKKISFSNCSLTDNSIPFGVEEIILSGYNYNEDHANLLSSLPESVRYISNIHIKNGTVLTSDMIQPSIDTLIFTHFNQRLENNTFPSTLTHLTLNDHWDNCGYPLRKGDIPNGIQVLDIEYYNQELLPGILPDTLKSLIISFPDDYKIESGAVPNSVTNLTVYSKVNIEPNSLPLNLRKLNIQCSKLECNILPTSLKSLNIRNHCQIESGSLNEGLEKLAVSNTRIMKNTLLPSTLKTLIISFGCLVENVALNQGLTKFEYIQAIQSGHHNGNTVFDNNLSIGIDFFPQSLTNLKLHCDAEIKEDIIPSSVTILDLKLDISNFTLQPNVIPSAVTSLKLTNVTNFNIAIGSLPSSITKLKLGYFNTAFRKGILPSNLKSLKLVSFNRKIGKLSEFPNSLTFLKFEKQNASNIDPDILPNSIIKLIFSSEFSKPITTENVFPNSLKLLQLPQSMKTNNLSDWISDGCLSNSTTVLFKT